MKTQEEVSKILQLNTEHHFIGDVFCICFCLFFCKAALVYVNKTCPSHRKVMFFSFSVSSLLCIIS